MVRLKGKTKFKALMSKINFNSTMVRLKDPSAVVAERQVKKFQFHYGSVKR